MNCRTARERLLEADLSELRGEGDLALHLQSCERCRSRAQVILDQYAALRSALDGQAPRLDPAAVRRHAHLVRRPLRPRWAIVVPLALAASLAILVVTRRHQPGSEPRTAVPPLPSTGEGLDVQGPPGQTVAVFQTDNPNIVVIWSF